jgi:HK97 family phage prohead protease
LNKAGVATVSEDGKRPTLDGIERRAFQVIEFRAEGGDGKPVMIYGHAAVFNQPADSGWGWVEQVAPGAFTRAIKEDDVRALKNHNPDWILGRTKSKTLTLREDSKGLYFEVEVPDTTYATDLVTSMRRGDIDQMSFQFRSLKTQWDFGQDPPLRTLQEVKLYDVSPVTFPFYEGTDAQVRSILTAAAGVDDAHLSGILTRAQQALKQAGLDGDELRQFLTRTAAVAHPTNDWEWQNDLLSRQLELLRHQ